MGGMNSFELIMQELVSQKKRMELLKAENHELRRQIEDLREGRGVFIDIQGQRVSVTGEKVLAAPANIETMQKAPTAPLTFSEATEQNMISTFETPLPSGDFFVEQKEQVSSNKTNFLEEALLDEFAAATTSPISVWTGPGSRKSGFAEDEKATLRRELIGSFLLE